MAGDTGAIGRISVGSKKKSRGLTFDLKGSASGLSMLQTSYLAAASRGVCEVLRPLISVFFSQNRAVRSVEIRQRVSSPPPRHPLTDSCSPPFTGQQFSGQIIPSATVMVVGIGKTEAKVEGLFSEVCRLDYKGNVFDAMGGEVLKGALSLEKRGTVLK